MERAVCIKFSNESLLMSEFPIDESRRERFTLFEQYFYDNLGSRIAVALRHCPVSC